MAVVVAIVLTTLLVAPVASFIAVRRTNAAFLQAIGGPKDAEPVGEHRRLLADARNEVAASAARTDLLALSLDALTSGVIVTDHAGKILVRNRLASEISTRLHERTLVEAAAADLLAKATQGSRGEREVDIFGPPRRNLFVHAVPITADSQVVGALAVIDDVTDHHRIEKTRRDFVANLSHELRTPVGAVSLLAEMLVDEVDPETRDQLTNRMLLETKRMTETIDDLLELSRIESSSEDYDDMIVVQELLEEAVERARVMAENSNIEIGAVAPSQAITTIGNRSQLATALANLVENAVKYSSAGDSVSVRARVDADADAVAFIVQDTGRGIPGRDQDRIFERFYRVDPSRHTTTGGSGIGLSIVRHVAINHGGHVAVDSLEGEGSTFTLVVPRVNQPDEPAQFSPDERSATIEEASPDAAGDRR